MNAQNQKWSIRHGTLCRDEISIACLLFNGQNMEHGDDELAFIVRACNAHDALVSALERALLELSAIEHGLLGPEHAVKRNGCASATIECRAALAQVTP